VKQEEGEAGASSGSAALQKHHPMPAKLLPLVKLEEPPAGEAQAEPVPAPAEQLLTPAPAFVSDNLPQVRLACLLKRVACIGLAILWHNIYFITQQSAPAYALQVAAYQPAAAPSLFEALFKDQLGDLPAANAASGLAAYLPPAVMPAAAQSSGVAATAEASLPREPPQPPTLPAMTAQPAADSGGAPRLSLRERMKLFQ
jgi:hypothetical protein